MEIWDSGTAPIFLLSNYFRQKYLEIATCAVSLLNNTYLGTSWTQSTAAAKFRQISIAISMDSHIVQWCSQHRMMLDRDTVAEQWYKSTSQALALSPAQNWSPHELTMIRGSQTMIQEHVSSIALWSPHHDKRIFHNLPLLCFVVCYSFCFKSPLCLFLCFLLSCVLSTCTLGCMFLCIIIVIPAVYNIHNNNNGHMYNLVCTGWLFLHCASSNQPPRCNWLQFSGFHLLLLAPRGHLVAACNTGCTRAPFKLAEKSFLS